MTISTQEQVLAWLGNPKLDEDLVVDCWQAAEAYVDARVMWEPVDVITDDDGNEIEVAPADLVQAVNILTARYLARRNTPDGMVGLGELGAVQVPYTDADVERLLNPWRYFPVA